MSFGKETTHVSDSSTPNFAGPALGEAPLARQASAGATAAGALLDLDDDALALIAACVVPGALLPLQLVNRRLGGLFGTGYYAGMLWWAAFRGRFGYGFLAPVPQARAKEELRRLGDVARDAFSGKRWRFRGFEREGENVRDATEPASEFEWRLEIDNIEWQLEMPSDYPRPLDDVRPVLWWNKLRSRWGNTTGMNSWQPEYLAVDSFEADATGAVLVCHGVECGAGLGLARYGQEAND